MMAIETTVTRKRPGVQARDVVARFHGSYRVEGGTECWVWQKTTKGGGNGGGYGQFCVGSRTDGTKRRVYAHRFAYETFVGPVPKGKELDHLCRNRACCNPSHLEAVTRSVNVRRGDGAKLRTHCKRGHAMVGRNVAVWGRKNPQRQCRACAQFRSRR